MGNTDSRQKPLYCQNIEDQEFNTTLSDVFTSISTEGANEERILTRKEFERFFPRLKEFTIYGRDYFTICDIDDTNKVSFEEFITGYLPFCCSNIDQRLDTFFRIIEEGNSGIISKNRLENTIIPNLLSNNKQGYKQNLNIPCNNSDETTITSIVDNDTIVSEGLLSPLKKYINTKDLVDDTIQKYNLNIDKDELKRGEFIEWAQNNSEIIKAINILFSLSPLQYICDSILSNFGNNINQEILSRLPLNEIEQSISHREIAILWQQLFSKELESYASNNNNNKSILLEQYNKNIINAQYINYKQIKEQEKDIHKIELNYTEQDMKIIIRTLDYILYTSQYEILEKNYKESIGACNESLTYIGNIICTCEELQQAAMIPCTNKKQETIKTPILSSINNIKKESIQKIPSTQMSEILAKIPDEFASDRDILKDILNEIQLPNIYMHTFWKQFLTLQRTYYSGKVQNDKKYSGKGPGKYYILCEYMLNKLPTMMDTIVINEITKIALYTVVKTTTQYHDRLNEYIQRCDKQIEQIEQTESEMGLLQDTKDKTINEFESKCNKLQLEVDSLQLKLQQSEKAFNEVQGKLENFQKDIHQQQLLRETAVLSYVEEATSSYKATKNYQGILKDAVRHNNELKQKLESQAQEQARLRGRNVPAQCCTIL